MVSVLTYNVKKGLEQYYESLSKPRLFPPVSSLTREEATIYRTQYKNKWPRNGLLNRIMGHVFMTQLKYAGRLPLRQSRLPLVEQRDLLHRKETWRNILHLVECDQLPERLFLKPTSISILEGLLRGCALAVNFPVGMSEKDIFFFFSTTQYPRSCYAKFPLLSDIQRLFHLLVNGSVLNSLREQTPNFTLTFGAILRKRENQIQLCSFYEAPLAGSLTLEKALERNLLSLKDFIHVFFQFLLTQAIFLAECNYCAFSVLPSEIYLEKVSDSTYQWTYRFYTYQIEMTAFAFRVVLPMNAMHGSRVSWSSTPSVFALTSNPYYNPAWSLLCFLTSCLSISKRQYALEQDVIMRRNHQEIIRWITETMNFFYQGVSLSSAGVRMDAMTFSYLYRPFDHFLVTPLLVFFSFYKDLSPWTKLASREQWSTVTRQDLFPCHVTSRTSSLPMTSLPPIFTDWLEENKTPTGQQRRMDPIVSFLQREKEELLAAKSKLTKGLVSFQGLVETQYRDGKFQQIIRTGQLEKLRSFYPALQQSYDWFLRLRQWIDVMLQHSAAPYVMDSRMETLLWNRNATESLAIYEGQAMYALFARMVL